MCCPLGEIMNGLTARFALLMILKWTETAVIRLLVTK